LGRAPAIIAPVNQETAFRISLWILASFLSGSVPWGWLIGRIFYGRDVRKLGSGNIGFTNVLRSFGAVPGYTCFLLDVAKGLLPVVLAGSRLSVSPGSHAEPTAAWTLMAVALAAVLGHTFTPWLGFKGGKGIATGLGVIIGLIGWYVFIPLAVFLAAAVPTRYISLGSILAALAFLAVTLLPVQALAPIHAYWPMAALTAALVLFTHRENIKRLAAGTENKFGSKKPAA